MNETYYMYPTLHGNTWYINQINRQPNNTWDQPHVTYTPWANGNKLHTTYRDFRYYGYKENHGYNFRRGAGQHQITRRPNQVPNNIRNQLLTMYNNTLTNHNLTKALAHGRAQRYANNWGYHIHRTPPYPHGSAEGFGRDQAIGWITDKNPPLQWLGYSANGRLLNYKNGILVGVPGILPSFKKGGKIPKSGLYKLHKGEVVVPAHRVKTVDKALKKSKRKPLKKVCKDCVITKTRKVMKPSKNVKSHGKTVKTVTTKKHGKTQ
jgi:hypothetical protein